MCPTLNSRSGTLAADHSRIRNCRGVCGVVRIDSRDRNNSIALASTRSSASALLFG